jgi:hypothetical protein
VTRALALAALLWAAPRECLADAYAPDSVLPALELPDAHGQSHVLDPSLRAVVYCRDMAAGDVVKEAVQRAGPDLFSRNNSVYVVDLAGMSSFVRRWFALPGLRRRPYVLLVDEDGSKTADFPARAGRPTVLVLDRLRVERIEQPASAEELVRLLEPAQR